MTYNEIIDDLFKYDKEYTLAHCISADSGHSPYAMGAGIVLGFNKRYNMKNKMLAYGKNHIVNVGDAIYIDNVINLITKPYVYSKPTYNDFTKSLLTMKKVLLEKKITKLALPLIGCGIDKLNWFKVREIIQDVFKDMEIDILVCFYNQEDWDKWH